jgi:uncharacterized protein with GYD domain
MSTYMLLISYTDKGKTCLNQFPDQDELARQFRAKGAELKACYLLLGQYDLAAIIEAAEDATITKIVAGIAAQGILSTETLRAFTPEEVRRISMKPQVTR